MSTNSRPALDALHARTGARCERSRSDVKLKLNIGIPFKGDPDELGAYAEACRELGVDELVIAAGLSRTPVSDQLDELARRSVSTRHERSPDAGRGGAPMIGLWSLARSAPERVAAIETDTGRSTAW